MAFKRINGVIQNTDKDAYLAARKRLEATKDRQSKDILLMSLKSKVDSLEERIKKLEAMIQEGTTK